MNKFTEGPWKSKVGQRVEVYGGGFLLLSMSGGELQRDLANAHLIAAAPDMYEALSYLLEREWQDDEGEMTLENARNMSKKALAKARGEE
jgi:hypothetical protein